mgnify:CR=1 FL=1
MNSTKFALTNSQICRNHQDNALVWYRPEKFRSALRMSRCREDCAFVLFDHLEPEAEIVCVVSTLRERKTKIGA